MTNPNEGAFPNEIRFAGDRGLTKREIFAMAAMQGFCVNASDIQSLVRDAVLIADALIEELEKEKR